ncbi:hypothetical protein DB42_BS00030 [Neochlamydia sp. EPS4]|nr:hypothetical protein DB42_BS00030 [Neochlamydia sp. EPS4]
MLECALIAGMKEGSYVHAIIDEAPWIAKANKTKVLQSMRPLN